MTSNGLAFSPDGRTLYHSDTPRFAGWRFGTIRSGRAVAATTVGQRVREAWGGHGRRSTAGPTARRWTRGGSLLERKTYEGGLRPSKDPWEGRLMAAYPFAGVARSTMPPDHSAAARLEDIVRHHRRP